MLYDGRCAGKDLQGSYLSGREGMLDRLTQFRRIDRHLAVPRTRTVDDQRLRYRLLERHRFGGSTFWKLDPFRSEGLDPMRKDGRGAETESLALLTVHRIYRLSQFGDVSHPQEIAIPAIHAR